MTVVSLQSEIARDVSSKLKLIQKIAKLHTGYRHFQFWLSFRGKLQNCIPGTENCSSRELSEVLVRRFGFER